MTDESIDFRTRVIISLQIMDAWEFNKQEINLMEVTELDGYKNYYFDNIYSKLFGPIFNLTYTCKKVVLESDVEKLLAYIQDMKLPKDPERRLAYLDGDTFSLQILNKKYEWHGAVPKGWEPLELVVKWIEILSEFQQFKEVLQRKLRLKKLRLINLRKHHPYSLPKKYMLYIEKLDPAGLFYRLSDAMEFVKSDNLWLELEQEPTNTYDKNAIKVMGCSKMDTKIVRRHIGYLPRGYAAAISIYKNFHELKPYLHRTYYDYRTKKVCVEFEIAGPVDRRKDFQEALIKAHIEDKTLAYDKNIII